MGSETELKTENGIKPEKEPKLDPETEPKIGLGKEIETKLETDPENAVHEGSNPPLKRDGSDEEYPNGDKKMGNIRTRLGSRSLKNLHRERSDGGGERSLHSYFLAVILLCHT